LAVVNLFMVARVVVLVGPVLEPELAVILFTAVLVVVRQMVLHLPLVLEVRRYLVVLEAQENEMEQMVFLGRNPAAVAGVST
jgi:hypothetical protein